MAYPTYITDAIVCGSVVSRTSDRFFLLFTREAGMVYAYAKSVREERSKQRYALQECSYIRATLVRGKSGWRIAGVEPLRDLYATAETRQARALLRNLVLLMRRVMQGEVAQPKVFDDVLFACMHASEYPVSTLGLVITLRVLHFLGYVAPNVAYNNLLTCTLTPEVLSFSGENEKEIKKAVHQALTESHL